MTLVKDAEADFIQDHGDRCKNHCNGILQSGERDWAQLQMQHGQV